MKIQVLDHQGKSIKAIARIKEKCPEDPIVRFETPAGKQRNFK